MALPILNLWRMQMDLVLAYQDNKYTEDLSAQLIFGGIGGQGKLPVTINEKWPSDFGIITPGNLRMKYLIAGKCRFVVKTS